MRFLIDADLPRSAKDLLRRYGHESIDVRDIGLGSASDSSIARYAQDESLCLLTGDSDFSDIRTYPPARYQGLVILHVPPNATASFILAFLEGFLKQEQLVNRITGRLVIIEPGRVRIRPSTE